MALLHPEVWANYDAKAIRSFNQYNITLVKLHR